MNNEKLKEVIIFWQCRMSMYPFKNTKFDIDEFIKRTIGSRFVDLGLNEDNYIEEVDKAIKELREEGTFDEDSLLMDYPTRDFDIKKLDTKDVGELYSFINKMVREEDELQRSKLKQ